MTSNPNEEVFYAATDDLVLLEHCVQPGRVGSGDSSLRLAEASRLVGGRGTAADPDVAQLPIHWPGVSGAGRGVCRPAECVCAPGGIWGRARRRASPAHAAS